MKLTDLNPKFITPSEGEDPRCRILGFECPVHPGNEYDEVAIRITQSNIGRDKNNMPVWEWDGQPFATMTLSPSILVGGSTNTHSHFWIKNGDISFA